MKIKEVMSSKLDIVSPDAKLSEVAKRMRDDDIGALPIVENDEVIGMITDRDIVVRSVAEGRDGATAARDAMSPELVVCSEDESVEDVAKRMAQAKVRRIPVLDKNDRLVGIASLGDLSRTAGASDAGDTLRKVSEPTSSARAL